MTEQFKYRPPIKYLFIGLGGLMMSVIFGMAIHPNEIELSIILGLFCLMTLAMGVGFIILFFKNFNTQNLILGNDFVEIPERWTGKTRLNFEDIIHIGEFDTYSKVIEIESKKGIHIIEKNWMKEQEFNQVKNELLTYWLNNDL